jgi:capsular exopolysaccharide synthesis family protein
MDRPEVSRRHGGDSNVSQLDSGSPESLEFQPKTKMGNGRQRSATPARAGRASLAAARRHGLVAAPTGSSGPDASALFKALKRRWLLAACLGTVVAAAAAAGAWFLLTPKHTAYALVQIAAGEPQILNTREGRNDFATYQRTQAARIKGRHVLNEALKDDRVKRLNLVRQEPEPIQFLETEIKVEYQEGLEFVKLFMTGSDPAELIPIVDAVYKAYLKEFDDSEKTKRGDRYHQLESTLDEEKQRLRKKRDRYAQMADNAGASDSKAADKKQQSLLFQIQFRNQSYLQVLADLRKAESRLSAHRAKSKSLPPPAQAAHYVGLTSSPLGPGPLLTAGAVMTSKSKILPEIIVEPDSMDAAIDSDGLVKAATDDMVKIQNLIDDCDRRHVRKNESIYVGLVSKLSLVKKRVEERRDELRADFTKRLRQKAQMDYELTLNQFEDEVSRLANEEKKLLADLEALNQQADIVGTASTELEMLKAEIKTDENNVGEIQNQLNKLSVELKSPFRVTGYQEAGLAKKDMKRQLLATSFAPVAALAGVFFCIAWWEYRARRIHSADEVVQGLGLRLVGAVPPLTASARNASTKTAEGLDFLEHNLVESIDGIRTVLLRDASVTATRVVMVTSATSGEGKTTLAGHLAGSLARAGRRTLLMDCDLRRPTAHQLFEQTLQPGVSEVLLKEIELAAAVRPTTVSDNLWLLPAGQWDREVVQALAQDGTSAIFEQLRNQFDFIVVDSSPVLAATDSLLVGQHVDAVILALLRDVSKVPPVQAAAQRLTSLGIRVLGAVVNGLSPDNMYGNGYHPAKHAVAR